jgi:hypothetical protein
VLGVAEAGCGGGLPMNILKVLARWSLGVHLSWAIPRWIFNDSCSRPIPIAVGLRLLPGLLLAVLQDTLIMANPLGDQQ